MKRFYLIVLLMLPFVAIRSFAEGKGGIPQYIPAELEIPAQIGSPLNYCIDYVLKISELQAELERLKSENEQLRAEIENPEPETSRSTKRKSSTPAEPALEVLNPSDREVLPDNGSGSKATEAKGGKDATKGSGKEKLKEILEVEDNSVNKDGEQGGKLINNTNKE